MTVNLGTPTVKRNPRFQESPHKVEENMHMLVLLS